MDEVAKQGFEDTCIDLLMWAMGRQLTKSMSFDTAKEKCAQLLMSDPKRAIDVIVESLKINDREGEVASFLQKATDYELITNSDADYFLKKEYVVTRDYSQSKNSGFKKMLFIVVIILAIIGLVSLF